MGPGFVGTLSGMVGTQIASDSLGAVPVTKAGATSPTLVDGTVVNPSATTPRQHLFMSAGIVILACLILLGGARFLRNARIA